jgi:beta-glucosidase/6-phospho-beta-glucosidase/beta-galactosidase
LLPPSNPGTGENCIEVWGGVECTYNRVRDLYLDQMELSGHTLRCSDIEEFYLLGIKTLRVGILWERHVLEPSWKFADERLHRIQKLGMRCIVGLVHHGSGPSNTSLLDPAFAPSLAAFAREVAERYPWLDAYTPVNEPHTTARFSGLYGIWYPHHMSRASYLRALLNQCRATVLSMQAVRAINPHAKLIQTEDTGTITGTEALRSIWELLNDRRWLGFDLLCGRVNRDHPLFAYIRNEGISEREILWFADHPCPPDIIGINYYATSDRYIDHRCELYPPERGSAEGPFVDVEAVRVRGAQPHGFGVVLTDAWLRYGIPVAITEVHLGGPVEEQIRWATHGWRGVMKARQAGVHCAAMTFWALLGSHYWNHLVTCDNGHYEPGVFDVRSGRPQRTELAEIVGQIARGEVPRHPALAEPGWWQNENSAFWPQFASIIERAPSHGT